MTKKKLTSHADRDVVESFPERGFLLVEGGPSPTLIGDLLDVLDAIDEDDDRQRGQVPLNYCGCGHPHSDSRDR
jgi:hypothetical protein